MHVSESSPASSSTSAKRFWTYADYLQLDDSPRYEILNGELLSIPAPDVLHQRVVRNISVSLWEFVRDHRCGEVFWSPVDVILNEAQSTVVQPDVVFVAAARADGLVRRRGIFGAPDLLVEVLSPATGERDRVHKKALYEQAGVAEYWLLDPLNGRGMVYRLTGAPGRERYALSQSANRKNETQAMLGSQALPGWRVNLNRLF